MAEKTKSFILFFKKLTMKFLFHTLQQSIKSREQRKSTPFFKPSRVMCLATLWPIKTASFGTVSKKKKLSKSQNLFVFSLLKLHYKKAFFWLLIINFSQLLLFRPVSNFSGKQGSSLKKKEDFIVSGAISIRKKLDFLSHSYETVVKDKVRFQEDPASCRKK